MLLLLLQGIFHNYLEVKEVKPKLKRLKEILNDRKVESNSDLKEIADFGKSFDDLLNVVQASKAELKLGLEAIEAVSVDGLYVLLDLAFRERILNQIVNFIDSNSYDVNAVDKAETLDALQELFPRPIVEQVFDQYCEDGRKLRQDKVARFYGLFLLETCGSSFNLEDFLSMWRKSVNDEAVSLDLLSGLCIVSYDKKSLKHFDEADLPENVHDRFRILFDKKEKWTLEEIDPYLKRITTKKLNAAALLTKFARVSKVDGVKYFGAKHAN